MLISNLDFILTICFALLGTFIKLMDDAFDKNFVRSEIGYGLILPSVALWVYLMSLSSYSATILLAVFSGVIIAGKVDNLAFRISALLIIITLILNLNTLILWPYLIFLALLAVIDEKGNDWADVNNGTEKWIFFLRYRFALKTGIFLLVIFGIFPWIYFFAFLAFDLAYDGVGHMIEGRGKGI